jgi:AsmA protein
MALDVEGVRLTNAALTYRDEASGSQYRLTGLTLRTGRFAPAVPMPFNLETRIDATQPAVAVNVRAKGELSADLERQAIRINALQLGVKGTAAGIALDKADLALPRLEIDNAAQGVRLEGMTLALSARQANDRFELNLTAPLLSLSEQAAGGSAAQLTFKLAGPDRAANGTLALSTLQGTRQALRIDEVAVTLEAKQAGNDVRGRLTSPLEANLTAKTVALPKIGGQFTLRTAALPQPAALSLSGSARAALAEEKAEANVSGKLDESNFQGDATLTKFSPPRVAFKFSIDKLDVDRYMAKAASESPAKPATGSAEQTPIDLSALKTLNLDGSVRVGQLKASGVTASKVRADVKAANGQVRIEPLSADLYEGTLRGAVGIDAQHNRFTVKQTLSNVALGPLLHDALSKDLLAGRGDVVIDAVATGNTVEALKRTLTGQTKLSLQDGAIKGINLAEALRKAKNLFSSGQDAEHAAAKGEQTDFSEFKASFALRDGKARNDDLSVKSPFLRLAGGGEVDLLQAALDYRAQVSVVASSQGQGGRDLAELAGLTVPVHITGPLTAPKFKLELRNVLRAGAETKLEEKKEALKEKLKGRLQERLGEPAAPPPDGAAQSQERAQEPSTEAPKEEVKETPKEEVKRRLKDLLR